MRGAGCAERSPHRCEELACAEIGPHVVAHAHGDVKDSGGANGLAPPVLRTHPGSKLRRPSGPIALAAPPEEAEAGLHWRPSFHNLKRLTLCVHQVNCCRVEGSGVGYKPGRSLTVQTEEMVAGSLLTGDLADISLEKTRPETWLTAGRETVWHALEGHLSDA
jgi:hypothetical protein